MSDFLKGERPRLLALAHETLAHAVPTEFSFNGALGTAIFACALARLDESFNAWPWIEQAVAYLNAHGAEPGLVGLSGLGAVIASSFPDEEEVLTSFDESLIGHLPRLVAGDWHFGHSGIAVYAALRSQTPTGQALAQALAEGMRAAAIPLAGGVVYALKSEPAGTINMGMAHGLAGALTGLTILFQLGFVELETLIRGSLTTLWRFERTEPNRFAWFYRSADDTNPILSSRGSWCWGDPGVLRAAYLAASACGDAPSRGRALAAARRGAAVAIATSWPKADEGGLSFCCGCSIAAHIYGKYWRETQEVIFRRAQEHILVACLDHLSSVPIFGLSHGRMGVLLALLYGASDEDPSWDIIRGLSLPVA